MVFEVEGLGFGMLRMEWGHKGIMLGVFLDHSGGSVNVVFRFSLHFQLEP